MAFIEWKDSYSIGVEKVDEDHRQLVDVINELHAAITRAHGRDSIEAAVDELETMLDMVDELIDYATDHFAWEEEYMLKYAYSGYAEMKQAHQQFMSMTWDIIML